MKAIGIILIGIIILSFNSSITSRNDPSYFYEDKNYVEGDIIVMFKRKMDANAFVQIYNNIGLRVKDVLVEDMNIYLLEYDTKKSQAVDALLLVMRNDNIAIAQFNHILQERSTIPNDMHFNLQWDKHNLGQTGGVPDADIDAPEAWDNAIGGTTVFGDTIVIAVVDQGQQIDHQDLDTWRNWEEIQGNGIDDDSNGYIDDINGWNASSDNGTIPGDPHGTHCAGIAGAKGNNNFGIAGVNWKVKTMPVVYGDSPTFEQGVIKAYGYVLKQRKIYNETNGTRGAFIVSTNSSFGVDYGEHTNYPLWCAFYDSLGAAGILSAGAGPNNNVNIDIVGDIPTTCPSDFLIAVTNTTKIDAKNSNAGYGPINMDLGAPGTNIYSTIPGNNYSLASGTSMATPQVAGAVGLLYAGADNLFIQLVKNDPDSAALLFKEYILSSVDTIPSMSGITLSKGRLNINKMLQKVRVPTINIKIIPEGFYNTMTGKLNIKDTVRAYLHINISPYNVVDSTIAVIDSVTFTGAFQFVNAPNGTYYIVIKHRNTIETWSKSGGEQFTVATIMSYDFTDTLNKAFGNNMKQVDASPVRFAIYSGDANHDGIVDISDNQIIDNDSYRFISGYVSTDLNGDETVDIADATIADNNAYNFVSKVTP